MKVRNLKPLSLLLFFLALACERICIKTRNIEIGLLQIRKIYCLQARPCIFQPGNFKGWVSEGVNNQHFCLILSHVDTYCCLAVFFLLRVWRARRFLISWKLQWVGAHYSCWTSRLCYPTSSRFSVRRGSLYCWCDLED